MGTDKPSFGEIGSMDDLVKLYVDTLHAWTEALPHSRDASEPAMGSSREIMLLLARAQAEWLTSGLRYGRQISDLMAERGFDLAGLAAVARPMTHESPTEQTLRQIQLIDKARGFLQQVAEASLSEAEALRTQLLKIEAELRDLQDGGTDSDPKRNVRAKR